MKSLKVNFTDNMKLAKGSHKTTHDFLELKKVEKKMKN